MFGWQKERWDGEADLKIAGLQTFADRQKGRERTQLFIMDVIKRIN